MTFVLRMLGARAALVLAAAAVLLRLRRGRRRRDRRAALGHPERARRADERGALDHRLRRARSAPTGRGPTKCSTRARAAAGDRRRARSHGRDRDRDDGAGGRRARTPRGWWSCAACSRSSRSTARSCCRTAQPYSHDLLRGRGALVRPELLTQLGTDGRRQRLIIGGQPFTIRGVIAQEPGRRVGAFSFGSRVLVDYDDLRATGLLAFGSRASYQILLRVREQAVESLTRDIRRDFRDRFVQARSYRSTEDDIGEDLMRAENYLSLVGFIMVVLGGIGVWSVTRVFVKQKIRSVAILKCLGRDRRSGPGDLRRPGGAARRWRQPARRRRSRRVAIAAIPASAAAAFGNVVVRPDAVGGAAGPGGRPAGVAAVLAGAAARGPAREAAAAAARARHAERAGRRGAAPWRAALVPAWRAPRRSGADRRGGRRSRAALVARGGLAGGVASGRRWSSAAALPAIALVLHGAGRAARPRGPAARRRRRSSRCATRSVSLRRPGNQTRVILLAVGLGSFFVLGVRALQANLLDAVLRAAAARRRGHVPDRHPAGPGRRRPGVLHATRRSASRG